MSQTGIFSPSCWISNNRWCNECLAVINTTTWYRCVNCELHDLCHACYEQTRPAIHERCGGNVELVGYDPEPTEEVMEAKLNFVDEIKQTGNTNDSELFYVIERLKQLQTNEKDNDGSLHHCLQEQEKNKLISMIITYHLSASDEIKRVLCLDCGGKKTEAAFTYVGFIHVLMFFSGVRAYMPIKVLMHAIETKFPYINDLEGKNRVKAQKQFTSKFDYFVGTSTGGLIAFCVAVNYDLYFLKDIYVDFRTYFEKNMFGLYVGAKYDVTKIHNKIDEIISGIPMKADSTLGDLHKLLNPFCTRSMTYDRLSSYYRGHNDDVGNDNDGDKRREKVLIINAYNVTKNEVTVFNTSYIPHVRNKENNTADMFIDGGVFANNPELTALWTIECDRNINKSGNTSWTDIIKWPLIWAKNTSTGWFKDGIVGWLYDGLVSNTLMDATGNFTEKVTTNLATMMSIRRMRFNFKMTKPMALDNDEFIKKFDKEWENVLENEREDKYYSDDKLLKDSDDKCDEFLEKTSRDFKALMKFYNTYIDYGKQNLKSQ
ncbi:unnamed protein product [Didymodactylos carnosus]|uniref:PNPLA domain-containing protein n=1 Tax=Didymodactylos carnosus TaxID=1234261 RepID=A0A8S2LUU2_9BILA|nr:unnamed protein product [Didymodactylos carnosus]CAF3922576.1 unnamed protein product [Didymodactylos carnosus]